MANEDKTKHVEDKDLSRTRRMTDAESEKVSGAILPQSLKEREFGSISGSRASLDQRTPRRPRLEDR